MSDTELDNPANDLPQSDSEEPPKPAGRAQSGPLRSGSGAGKVDYMEARIASIEAHVDHMRDDLGDMRLDLREVTKSVGVAGSDMRELDARIASLPGKGWMFTAMLFFTIVICAVIIYLEQIRQYIGMVTPTVAP